MEVAALAVLVGHVEAGAEHLRVAESHRLVQVVDAVEEVAVVAAGDSQDHVISVVEIYIIMYMA